MHIKELLGLTLIQLGLDPRKVLNSLRGTPYFVRDLLRYRRMSRNCPQALPLNGFLPVLGDRFEAAGSLPQHYFHQDLWVARKILAANPSRHVDIGSLISGFVSHLLVFRGVEIVDIRPLPERIEGLTAHIGDATHLNMFADDSLESLSSLHAGEHFGLGRYGDQIDPEAHITFMRSLARVLAPAGRLYFSVPCGLEQLYFNSHRVISPHTVLKTFSDLQLVSFACVKDDRHFYPNCNVDEVARERYGCGIFEFTK